MVKSRKGLLPDAVMPRDGSTHDGCHDCIDQTVINAPSDVVLLQVSEAVFCLLHAAGLRAAYEHVHLRSQAPELFEHIALKIVVGDAHNQCLPGRLINAGFFGSIGHDSSEWIRHM